MKKLLTFCVLTLSSALSYAQVSNLPEMSFKANEDTFTISGSLDFKKFAEFSELVELKKYRVVVFNDVLGGTLRTVESFGNKIASLNIETRIDGKCFSACALVFLKGLKRTVNKSRQNVIAFHGPRLPNGEKLPAFAAFHKRWIIASTNGKFRSDLIDQALEINANDGALFIYTDSLFGFDRTWALLCEHFDQCKSVPNANPYELGILTD